MDCQRNNDHCGFCLDYFDLNWGLAPNPARQGSLVERFSKNRAYRALILPYSLVDVPESVNRYSIRLAAVSAGFALIPYFMADSFGSCTYQDVQWILKRLARLTLEDFQQIVDEGNYPAEISTLVLAKLLYRVNNLLEIFNVPSQVKSPSLNITSGSGLVKKGKVTQEYVPGYPQRFSHGERTSPYSEGDFARYMGIYGQSSLIQTGLAKMNEYLRFLDSSKYAADYQKDLYKKVVEHIRHHPGQPFHRPIATWGGAIGGPSLNLGRYVSTGTYNDSSAPVQLVDNLSVSVSAGYFRVLDGLAKASPVGWANVSLVYDYTHVRPIQSMKEALKDTWYDKAIIPAFMGKLAAVLTADGTAKEISDKILEKPGDKAAGVQKSLDAFLLDLRDGEVFTITESLAVSSYLQASASIDVLAGVTPIGFLNSVSLGFDGNRAITKQVQFVRISNDRFNGLHVYVRGMKNQGRGLELNANFYMNILKLRNQATEADIRTDAFIIDYNPGLSHETDENSEEGQKFKKTRDNLRVSLYPLFTNIDTEMLYDRFADKKFKLEHQMKAKETKTNFLLWRFSDYQEDHHLKIIYPPNPEQPELKPEDEAVEIFTTRRGQLTGRDILGFLIDLASSILSNNQTPGTLNKPGGGNPANSPFGKARWRMVTSEIDLSKTGEQYKDISMINHVWGGWSLKKEKFQDIISEISDSLKDTELASYKIIDPNEFLNTKKLDFYRISANLSILNGGLARIRSLVSLPAEERYLALITMMGRGNFEIGYAKYLESCYNERRIKPGNRGATVDKGPFDWAEGKSYKCLDQWMMAMIRASQQEPNPAAAPNPAPNPNQDRVKAAKWINQIIYLLDQRIPTPELLKVLGKENYLYFVRINGFRVGDEDGDLEYFSNSFGDPEKEYPEAGGIVGLYTKKTGIIPTEINRKIGGFD